MKKIICAVITLFIIAILILLAFSFNIKNVLINTLNKEVVSNELSSKLTSYLKDYGVSSSDIDKIDNALNNTNSSYLITEKYFDEIVRAVTNNEEVKTPDVNKDILDILNDSNVNLSDNEKSLIASKISGNNELSKIYKNVTNEVINNMTEENKNIIKYYNLLISNSFKIVSFIILFILIILLGLIKKSVYKPIINISLSLLISGLFLSFLLPEITSFIINDMINEIGNYKVNLNSIINTGYIYLVIFSILILIYLIIIKIKDKITINNENY